jgi:hypothetical protein
MYKLYFIDFNVKWQHQQTIDSFFKSAQISWEKFAYLKRHLKECLFCICGKTSSVCFHKRPCYYDKTCPTCHIIENSRSQTWHFKEVGVYWCWRVWCHLGMVFWNSFKRTLTNTQVEPRWCILHNIWCNSYDNMTMKITEIKFYGSWRHSWIKTYTPIILGHLGQ